MKIKTKSGKKVFAYIEDFIRTNTFLDGVSKIRSKFGIPEAGYVLNDIPDEILLDIGPFYKPKQLKISSKDYLLLLKEFNHLKESLEFSNLLVSSLLLFYLFHNKIDKNLYLNTWLSIGNIDESNLCIIEDLPMTICETPAKFLLNGVAKSSKKYPVLIKITPEVTQNEVVDYVKKNWKLISYIQGKYKKNRKLGRVKMKDEVKQQMYDFIYKHRHLKLQKILGMLGKNGFEIIDEGHIAKIISLENLRRKEV